MTSPHPTNPKDIAERGEQIYNDKYRQKFEKKHLGKFMVIEVISEKAYLGESPDQAYEEAHKVFPKGVFHLIKVGSPGAFRISSARGSKLDWVFR